jgi:hypothetical protein
MHGSIINRIACPPAAAAAACEIAAISNAKLKLNLQNVILKPNTNEKKLNWFQKAFETNQ